MQVQRVLFFHHTVRLELLFKLGFTLQGQQGVKLNKRKTATEVCTT